MVRPAIQDLAHVRSDLVARIESIERGTGGHAPLASDLEAIRRIAARAGIAPAVTVAHAIEAALARGERGPLVRERLAILRDAVICTRTDARACETYAAACSVRLID